MNYKMIPLDSININDTSYQYQHKFTDPERFRSAMKKCSITDPVYLHAKENTLIILDGFARINAIREIHGANNHPLIPAFVLTDFELTYEIHLSIIIKQDLQSPLTFSEKVTAFNLLKREFEHINPVSILQDLGLPATKEYASVYNSLENASANWLSFLSRHRVPGRRVKTIVQSANLAILEPLLSLDYGINKLEQAIVMLTESAKRENISIESLIHLFLPQQNVDIQPDVFFNKLFQYRYPRIYSYQKKINQHLQEIQIPQHVQIILDKDGEAPGIQLLFHIQKDSDITDSENWLEQNGSKIRSLLKERLTL